MVVWVVIVSLKPIVDAAGPVSLKVDVPRHSESSKGLSEASLRRIHAQTTGLDAAYAVVGRSRAVAGN